MNKNNMSHDYNPFDQMTFTYDRCFLCGTKLEDNKTKEHVFPKWLQNKFDLWDKHLSLLNGTTIKYKDLTIPCCKCCNEIMSAKIEKPIQVSVEKGYNLFTQNNRDIVFQWLNKIAYGVLFKELSLKIDRSNPTSCTIYNPEELKERKMQFLFLQSIISDSQFHNKPYSMLFFRIKNRTNHYWAWDNPFCHTFCMQMNDIGIIANLMDNGYNEGFFLNFEKQRCLLKQELHPVQFLEVCSQFVYKCSLFYRDPFYTTVFDENMNPKDIISHSVSGDAYDDWNQEEYAHIFDLLLSDNNYSLETGKVYQGNDLVCSTLFDENGIFIDMPFQESSVN